MQSRVSKRDLAVASSPTPAQALGERHTIDLRGDGSVSRALPRELCPTVSALLALIIIRVVAARKDAQAAFFIFSKPARSLVVNHSPTHYIVGFRH